MEAVLVREGDREYVRIEMGGRLVAEVHDSRPCGDRLATRRGEITVLFFDPTPEGWARCVGYAYLDRSGEARIRWVTSYADPYWKDMPRFVWLMDMAIDAGLDLAGTGAVS